MHFDIHGYNTREAGSMNVYLPAVHKEIYRNSSLHSDGKFVVIVIFFIYLFIMTIVIIKMRHIAFHHLTIFKSITSGIPVQIHFKINRKYILPRDVHGWRFILRLLDRICI